MRRAPRQQPCHKPLLSGALAFSLTAALIASAALYPEHASAQQQKADPAAIKAMCAGRGGQGLKDCQDFCISWPASRACLMMRNWGRAAGDCWITAAKKRMPLAQACKMTGFPAQKLDSFNAWVDATMMLPYDWPATGPFYDKAKKQAKAAFDRITAGAGMYRKGKHAEAVRLLKSARAELEQRVGPTDRSVCLATSNLANGMNSAGMHKEAIKVANEAIAICRIALGGIASERVASSYWVKALAYEQLDMVREMLEASTAAVIEADKSLTATHAKTAEIRLTHATAPTDSGRGADAYREAEGAWKVLATLAGPTSPKALIARSRMASALNEQGDAEGAIRIAAALLATRRAILPAGHYDIVLSTHNLALYYAGAGKVAEARKLFEEALAILERDPVKNAKELATVEHLYGRVLRDAGQFTSAMKMFGRSYERRLQLYGATGHQTIVVAHDTEALRAQLSGERKGLLKIRMFLYGQMRKKYGPTHAQTVRALVNYAQTLARDGNLKQALHLSEQALPAMKAAGDLGAATLQQLQMVTWYLDLGDKKKAARHAEGVGPMLDKGAVKDRNNHLNARIMLADSWRRLGNEKLARKHAVEIAGLAQGMLADGIDVAAHDTALLQTVYSLTSARSAHFESAWSRPREALDAALFWQGMSARAESIWRANQGQARSSLEQLRTRISPAAKQVCADLRKTGAALLVYVRWSKPLPKRGELTHAGHYHAVTLSPRGCKAAVVDIGDSDDVEATVMAYRKGISDVTACIAKRRRPKLCKRQLNAMRAAGTTLRNRIWAPVARHLPGKARVWVVPDGDLGQVSLASLADSKGRYLVEDREIALLPYPAAARRLAVKASKSAGAFIAGDLDYQQAAADPKKAASLWQMCSAGKCQSLSGERAGFSLQSEDVAAVRGAAVCGRQASWRALPPTEAPDVANFLSQQLGGNVVLASHQNAIEPAVRRAFSGRRIVHLATHGFFSPAAKCLDANKIAVQARKEVLSGKGAAVLQKNLFDPLKLSAVVLSGANGLAGADPRSDGVLSGREVARMDLSGTELVVLSACETGLGEQQAGEGAFGLARAFLISGARHVITSLWQVPSRETAELFQSFYAAAYGSKGVHPATALRNARLDLIKRLRAGGLPANAYFWAAFEPLSAGL